MLQNSAVHVAAAIVLSLARVIVIVEASRHVEWLGVRTFSEQLWRSTFINPLFYALLLGIAHAELYYERYRERDAAAERLAAGLADARLHALKMQLQPHFLVEYDNTQNRANHIHTVWRDFDGDFGRDLLREHYRNGPHAH